MKSVEEIKQAIEQLPEPDRWQLFSWYEELKAAAWDAQIERDVKAGKLDAVIDAAIAADEAGESTPF